MREAITIVFPYVGMPTCIPACYGMIGVVQRKGPEYASARALRKDTISEEDAQKGRDLRGRIYSGVGNSQIFGLMDQYFTDLCEFDHSFRNPVKDAHLISTSYLFDRRHLGIPDRKSERGNLPGQRVSSDCGSCHRCTRSHQTNKKSCQSDFGYWELCRKRQDCASGRDHYCGMGRSPN